MGSHASSTKRVACVGKDDERYVDRLVRGLELRGLSAKHLSLPALRMAPRPPDITVLVGNAVDDGGAAVLVTLGQERGPFVAVMPSGALSARLEARQRGVHVVPRKDDGAETAALIAKLLADLTSGAIGSPMSAPPPPKAVPLDALDWDEDEPETQNQPQAVPWRPGAGRGISKVPPPKPGRTTLPGGVSFPPEMLRVADVAPLALEDVTRPDAKPLRPDVHKAVTKPHAIDPRVHEAETRPIQAPDDPGLGDDDDTVAAGYETLQDLKGELERALEEGLAPSDDPDATSPQRAWRPPGAPGAADVTSKEAPIDDADAILGLAPEMPQPARPPPLPRVQPSPRPSPAAPAPIAPARLHEPTPSPIAPAAPVEPGPSPVAAAAIPPASLPMPGAPLAAIPPATLPAAPESRPALAPSAQPPAAPPTAAATPLAHASDPGVPLAPSTLPPVAPPMAPVPDAPAVPVAHATPAPPKKRGGLSIALLAIGCLAPLVVTSAGAIGYLYVLRARDAEPAPVVTTAAPQPAPPLASPSTAEPAAPVALVAPPAPEPAEQPAVAAPPAEEPVAAAPPAEEPVAAAPPAEPVAPPTAAAGGSEDVAALVREGERALTARRYDDARAAFARAVAADDASAEAHAGLAQVAIATNDGATALAHADRVVRLRRLRSSSHVLLGDARRANGDPGGARRAWQRALTIDANDEEAQARLAGP